MKNVEFGNVVTSIAEELVRLQVPISKVVMVRDIYGKVTICLDFDAQEKNGNSMLIDSIVSAVSQFAPYIGVPSAVLCACDLFDSGSIFNAADMLHFHIDGKAVRLLERQITGHDWLRPISERVNKTSPRFAFYSIKGGVGRSTAMAAVAFLLAQSGKKVMVLDFDLESPGLASILLPTEKYCPSGIVDWLVEDATNNINDQDVFRSGLIARSPLADRMSGDIVVVPAMGAKNDIDDIRVDKNYLSKLSRIYAEIPRECGRPEGLTERLDRMVSWLERSERPDITLIDSRAGLHDLSAGSIVRITDETFFFIADTPQNWQGHYALFSQWCQFPNILQKIRDKVNIVHAMIPGRQDILRAQFLQKSYLLFSNTIYEEIRPGQDNGSDETSFNFDMDDSESPHYPVDIYWNNEFAEFSYKDFSSPGICRLVETYYGSIVERMQAAANQ